MNKKRNQIPPDGGWGYAVVFGSAISVFIIYPIMQNFGLLFRDVFSELGFTHGQISMIINTSSGVGLILGVFSGPAYKIFSLRQYSLIGATMLFIGVLLTSLSTEYWEFLLYYGLLTAIGTTVLHTGISMSVNTYFRKRRTFAIGLTYMAGGLGSTLSPVALGQMVQYYGARGTALILSAFATHTFITAMLYQPVKWHYKYEVVDGSSEEGQEMTNMGNCKDTKENLSLNSADNKRFSNEDTNDKAVKLIPADLETNTGIEKNDLNRKEETLHLNGINDKKILDEETNDETIPLKSGVRIANHEDIMSKGDEMGKTEKSNSGCCRFFVDWFDLDLFNDPVFVSILVGMTFALTGEMIFSLMFPVILNDKGFDIQESAAIMTVVAGVDITFRIVVPLVEKLLKWKTRHMYMLTLIVLMTSRWTMTLVSSFKGMLLVGAFLGVGKGFRTVYISIVMANHVPIEKYAAANGLQTLTNGLLVLLISPTLGFLRDWYGHFHIVIHLGNLLSLTTLILWSLEGIIKKKSRSKDGSKEATSDLSEKEAP